MIHSKSYYDPAEQSYTLKELDNRFTLSAVIVVIATILMIGMFSAIWFLDGTPTFVMVKGGAFQQTILAIFIGYSAYISLRASISIRALRKKLIEGKPIDHHAPWKKHYRLHSTIAILFTVVAGMSAIIPFIQLAKMDTKTLPVKSPELPIVRLADVEKNSALVRGEPEYVSNDVDWSNRYSSDWSPFAPIQYESDEHAVVPGQMWDDGSGEYSPSIHTQVFQLRIPALTENLIADLIEKYQYDPREDLVVREHPDFNLLIVHDGEVMKKVFASKGKAVMFIRYHGYEDISSVIENMAEKMALISD